MLISTRRHPDRVRACASRRRQRGVVVLTFLLLALSISSYIMLQALNSAAQRDQAQIETTQRALLEAKRALLGYAVSYAYDVDHAINKGPGHLPCPDLADGSDPGVAESGDCRLSTNEETGRLPFRTLGLTALADGTGAPLWYAVSEAHRSGASPPLNSETPGALTVDNQNDIVAVIIAPGTAEPGQSRDASTSYSAADYLEGENASSGDGIFSSQTNDIRNDRVVRITRAELASATEKVVLGEVANALENYFHDPDGDDTNAGDDPDCGVNLDCDDGFPWLAAVDTDALYPGVVDNFALGAFNFGRLPLFLANTEFEADFLAAWDIQSAAAVYAASGAEPPSDVCLRRTDCFADFVVGDGTATVQPAPAGVQGSYVSDVWQQGRCTVTRAAAPVPTGQLNVRCTARRQIPVNSADGSQTRKMRRDYQLDLPNYVKLSAPTDTTRRNLVVQRSDSWAGTPAVLTITDYEYRPAATQVGSATLTVNGMSAGDSVALSGVPFELEVSTDRTVDRALSPGELPNWFWANNWQNLVFVEYARADSPGDLDTDCADDGSCLALTVRRPGEATAHAVANVRGVVLAAGSALAALSPGQTRPSAQRTDYLEGTNAPSASTVFEHREPSNTAASAFNDQVRLLQP